MAVQHPAAVVTAIPYPHGIMHQHDLLPFNSDLVVVLQPLKAIAELLDAFVVVAPNEMDAAIEPSAVVPRGHPVVPPEGKVAKMVDVVVRLDNCVPVGDNRFIHLNRVFERPVAITNDVCVAEMG